MSTLNPLANVRISIGPPGVARRATSPELIARAVSVRPTIGRVMRCETLRASTKMPARAKSPTRAAICVERLTPDSALERGALRTVCQPSVSSGSRFTPLVVFSGAVDTS